jgi:HEAT repeat protein
MPGFAMERLPELLELVDYDLPKDVTREQVIRALRHDTWQGRYIAALQVQRYPKGRNDILPVIAELLTDDKERVRIAAAYAILAIGPTTEIEDALKKNLSNESEHVRLTLADACVQSGVAIDEACALLRKMMSGDSHWRSVQAAEVAAEAIPEEAVPILLRELNPRKYAKGSALFLGQPTWSVVAALGRAGRHAKQAIHDLKQLEKNEAYESIRPAVREALEKIHADVKKERH